MNAPRVGANDFSIKDLQMTNFIDSIVSRLAELFDPQALGATAADLLANLLIGALTFVAYFLVWRGLDWGARIFTRRIKMDETTREFTLTALKFVVLTLAAVNALAAVGVNTASLIASLGVAGLTLGFAARDALSNLISGLLIYWDRPFVIGDLLEVGPHYGKVQRITLRSTRVITPDGRLLAVPNTEIINSTVASYTNFAHLRLDIPVTVGVEEDLDRVRSALLGLTTGARFMSEPAPRVLVKQLNDYNVGMELQAWIHDEREHIQARSDLREAVFKELTRLGVDMPFETFRLAPITISPSATA